MASVDRIQGLSGQQAIKTPCRLATTANITLSGEQTIDGVAAVEGDRVLVKDQTTTTQNGVYDVSTGSWTRSLDFDGPNDIADGTMVLVGSGSTNADLVFKLNATEPITIGTTALTFGISVVFSDSTPFIATLLDDTSASEARATLGLVIGTNVQAYNATLAALAAQTEAANKIQSYSADNTPSLLDFKDEDDMVSDSPTAVPSQQSVKAYVDSGVSGGLTPTGVVMAYVGATAPAGWLLLHGGTIGNGSSAGTERANADTEDLFTLLWNSMADTEAAVSTGRGANAAADFAANKTITLPDARGRVIAGKDDMGGSAASRLTTAGSGVDGATLGATGGAQNITLTAAQSGLPSHTHSLTPITGLTGAGGGGSDLNAGIYVSGSTGSSTGSTGGGAASSAHSNTQPTLILNKIIKL